ncbi:MULTISPECIES: cytochrome c biogenesis heme-transporting ATPase CcmA [Idiomarina]|jgi:heme exporter protein A|uniref:Cytochrome c biogenesis heme-transporting ATPase CcmA n=1 Tax=Idiomarina abyssalis TaxID=86102 RepID=A0A8I1G8G3_9GAMM|nr:MULTISPECIES: cytochrome c biogenesis heme-transporting ATPase CcmA [Idiomarina]KPD22163.1 heme ABC transporter ATP-binding protein [Idiomarina abyssalis]MAB22361.1 cytochrome c biogenesis heme-transporting ATPase CcmA [Idiomarina sp.]MAL82914.1 cytochrome c biogenesis heme-transporting ATPase CcmA [Idiomarina sp.]MAO67519.1 cytochrome c biogenesis heme-transporting ATPase CcmA [Idiomarina sp.]MBF80298.1 cytochrome c biogenesis heme-transporting ATPase CcmA [Idiomarina sp.]|tara:strand:+ start:3456 stop:4112 length:657 start_codon:yes stop_codon:yes gene_type:complete
MTQVASTNSPLLHAEQLSSIRGGRVLFENLNFSVSAGQLWQVSGPNGAGKSSLLRILTGLLAPSNGLVSFYGKPLSHNWSEYCEQLLFIGHKAAVKGELSARENFHWQQQLSSTEDIDAWELLEKLGLLGLEDELTARLSAGQQRRVALTRLWATQASLWILDEPFTALDVQGIALLQQRFVEHIQNGGTIIFTSHQSLTLSDLTPEKLSLEYQGEIL